MDEKVLEALMGTIASMDEVDPYAKFLIYGESGTGKTVLASTAVQERGLFIDAVEGWVSLVNFPELRSKMHRMVYQGRSQIDSICDAIEEGIEPFASYDTIILDEVSTMATLDLDVVLAANSQKIADKDPNVPTQPDFNANTERMRRTLSRLLKLPVNVILVSHVREDKDARTGVMYTRPSFTPKLRTTIAGFMHVIGRLTVDEQSGPDGDTIYVRKLQVRPTVQITAKTRIGGLPVFITDPNLGDLIKDWQATGSKTDDTPNEVITAPDAPVEEFIADSDSPDGEADNLTI